MTLYLLNCPSMPLPLPLLKISGKSTHCYPIRRRCLVHNAANKGQYPQVIRVRSLLAVCPCIPRAEPGEKWAPSILERKVIDPFTRAMDTLADLNILTWNFRDPVCRTDYEGFSDSMVEFQAQNAAAPTPPAEPEEEHEYAPFPYKVFLAMQ